MFSFVIKIAKDVIKAELLVVKIAALGFSFAKVLELFVEADPFKICAIINNNFLSYSPLFIFLY